VTKTVRPVVLAGGAGTRLWPVSTDQNPKHLLPLVGAEPLLVQTLSRVVDSKIFQQTRIVCSQSQENKIAELAPNAQLIVEPSARNSAPAIALAAVAEPSDAVILVLPSDHYLADPRPLIEAIQIARSVAESGKIVTFGVRPARPETGYGYIIAGPSLGGGAFEVREFVEKPSKDLARQLIDRDESYWNTVIFMFRADVMLDELAQHAPAILDAARLAMEHAEIRGGRLYPARGPLEPCPSISIDYAVMEKSKRIAVVPVTMQWSDVGSWDAIFEIEEKDENDNVLDELSSVLDAHRCLLKSTGPQVIAVGVKDLIVIATSDHVVVVNRSESQRVREVSELIASKNSK
jgi:mannose-1-phosphate guanylyltransferase/mannose-6-phosphate isomerase